MSLRPFDPEPPTPSSPTGLAVVSFAYVVCWIILTWPWLSGAVTVPWDAKAQFQPQAQFLARALWNGDSPFWTPYVFSGHPQVADPQSLIFSPPYLALALFTNEPSLWALDMTAFVAILMAGLALIVFFRDQGWHPGGGLLAAITFGFGAAMSWRIQHTGQVLSMVFLALTLVLLARALRTGHWGYGLGAGIAAAFMVLGRDQVALLGVYVLLGYVVWQTAAAVTSGPDLGAQARRIVLPLVVGAAGGLAIIAMPVLMTALTAETSSRPSIDLVSAGRGSLHPALLMTALVPDLYGAAGHMADYWGPPSFAWRDTDLYIAQNMGILYLGAVPALLILYGLVSGALLRGPVLFFTVATGTMLVYALGWYTPVFAWLHASLPGVAFFRRPADAVFLVGGLAAVLAGYVAHLLLSASAPLQRTPAIVTGLIVLAVLVTALATATGLERSGQAALPLAAAVVTLAAGALALAAALWVQPIRPALAVGLLVAATTLDIAVFNGPNTSNALPPAHYEVLEPDSRNETITLLKRLTSENESATRRDRVELAGLGFHWPNASLTHRLEHTLGYNPVRLALYVAATGAPDSSGLPEQRTFSPLMPSYRSTMADLLGLRFIATGVPIAQIDKRRPSPDLKLVARTADGYVYENEKALPRVLYATQARFADFDAALTTGVLPDVDFRQTVLLARTDHQRESRDASTEAPPPTHPATAKLTAYANTEVVIEAAGPGGYVVLNDIWHPWWVATVDGGDSDILRANVLFRAVAVPPGRHTVRFRFRPVRGAIRTLRNRLGL
ncbi:MAG: glycosyltransferase family 39 protein [Hyphomicrobiaceae bacterium]|nr:glycosyltransferase family 39 protein [Hyphomicrobiaceae bacterium]